MPELLGLGNAIVDFGVPLCPDNPFYAMLASDKGGFAHTTQEEFSQMLALVGSEAVRSCGGSVANSLHTYAKLGGKCAFAGRTGDDDIGRFFAGELEEYGIGNCLCVAEGEESGCAISWIDKSGEKTVCAKRRAARFVRSDAVNLALEQGAGWLFVEGYWLDGSAAIVEQTVCMAYAAGLKVAFTLADLKIVQEYRERLLRILPYVSVLFGNRREYEVMEIPAGKAPRLMLKTLGKDGVESVYRGQVCRYDAEAVSKTVNTTGAGDAFAGGFLYEYIRHRGIVRAVKTGQQCAAAVVQSAESHL